MPVPVIDASALLPLLMLRITHADATRVIRKGLLPEIGFNDVPREDVAELFKQFDTDGSGEISFAEVNRMVRKRASHSALLR